MIASRVAAVVVLAVVAAACGGGSADGAGGDETVGRSDRTAAVRTETVTDPSDPGRSLETAIYYPSTAEEENGPPDRAGGPFPLLLFSHGGGTTGRSYSNLLTRIAAAGYVIAAPTYRGPASGPADARLVLSQVIAAVGEPSHALHQTVDPGRVGAMGHSMGGGITLGFVFNSCCLDARVRAAVLLASARPTYPGEDFPAPGVPVLVVHGDADSRAPYAEGRRLFEQLRPPKFLLTILGGEHTPPFSGETQRADARVVVDSVVAFLDHYLKDDPGALDRLTKTVTDESIVARLERP